MKRFKSEIDTSCSFCGVPSGIVLTHSYFGFNFSNVINRNVLSRVSLCYFKDVLVNFLNTQKHKINEYFIINLLLLFAKFHMHRIKFTHQNPLFIIFLKRGSTVYPDYFIFQELLHIIELN